MRRVQRRYDYRYATGNSASCCFFPAYRVENYYSFTKSDVKNNFFLSRVHIFHPLQYINGTFFLNYLQLDTFSFELYQLEDPVFNSLKI